MGTAFFIFPPPQLELKATVNFPKTSRKPIRCRDNSRIVRRKRQVAGSTGQDQGLEAHGTLPGLPGAVRCCNLHALIGVRNYYHLKFSPARGDPDQDMALVAGQLI